MIHSQESRIDKVNNLSPESKALLGELERMSTKAAELITRLYTCLRNDGFEPHEARHMIEQRIEVSQRTLRRALPSEAKSQAKIRPQFADRMTAKPSNARLVLEDEEPKIPAPEYQVIIEHKPEPIAVEEQILPKEFRVENQLLKSVGCTRKVAWAISNGEDLVLVPNRYGVLNFKV